VRAEFDGFLLTLLSIVKNYESLYVVYELAEHTYFHYILYSWDGAVKFLVDKAISFADLPFDALMWVVLGEDFS